MWAWDPPCLGVARAAISGPNANDGFRAMSTHSASEGLYRRWPAIGVVVNKKGGYEDAQFGEKVTDSYGGIVKTQSCHVSV